MMTAHDLSISLGLLTVSSAFQWIVILILLVRK
jgi:hypothetical protein